MAQPGFPGACPSKTFQQKLLGTGLSMDMFEGSLEVKLPTIWTDEKQSREDAERRERLEERRVEEKESEERRYRCAKR
jgi:hypothetical protein